MKSLLKPVGAGKAQARPAVADEQREVREHRLQLRVRGAVIDHHQDVGGGLEDRAALAPRRALLWGQADPRQIELIKETTLKVADAGNGGSSEKKAAGEEAAAPRVTSDAAKERIAAAKARAKAKREAAG